VAASRIGPPTCSSGRPLELSTSSPDAWGRPRRASVTGDTAQIDSPTRPIVSAPRPSPPPSEGHLPIWPRRVCKMSPKWAQIGPKSAHPQRAHWLASASGGRALVSAGTGPSGEAAMRQWRSWRPLISISGLPFPAVAARNRGGVGVCSFGWACGEWPAVVVVQNKLTFSLCF